MSSLHKQHTLLKLIFGILVLGVLTTATYIFVKSLPEKGAEYRSSSQISTEESQFDFFGSSQNRLSDLMKQFVARNDLKNSLPMKDWERVHASANNPSFNEYLSIRDIALDQVNNTLTFSFDAANATLAALPTYCPAPVPTTLSSTGATMLSASGSSMMSYDIAVRKQETQELIYTGKEETLFSTSSSLTPSTTYAHKAYLEDITKGTYTLSIAPSCERVFPHEIKNHPELSISATVDKLVTNTSSIRRASINDSLLKITHPPISPLQNGEATLTIPYKASPEEIGEVHIPYIQSGQDLLVEAEVDLNAYFKEKYKDVVIPKTGNKFYVESDVFSVSFALLDMQGKEIRREDTPFFTDSVYNENFNTPYIHKISRTIKGLPKGDYQLVTRLLHIFTEEGNIQKDIIWQSKVSHIGIGDIMLLVGNEYKEYSPEQGIFTEIRDIRDLNKIDSSSTDTTGRNIAWPRKNCELSQDCTNQGWYIDFHIDLGAKLTSQLGYPVMILNELIPDTTTSLSDLFRQMNSNTYLTERLTTLAPSIVLLQYNGTSEKMALDEGMLTLAEIETELTSLEETLLQEYGGIPTFISTPFQSTHTNSDSFAGIIRAFTTNKNTTLLPGANLYPISLDSDTDELQKNIEQAWLEELLKYLK